MFFDWKLQLEKTTNRDLKDDTNLSRNQISLQKRPRILQFCYTHTNNNRLVPRRHSHHISSSKNSRWNDKLSKKIYFAKNILLNQSHSKIKTLINSDIVIMDLETFILWKIKQHVSKYTQKRNLHVRTTNHFMKHNTQKFLSNTKTVST